MHIKCIMVLALISSLASVKVRRKYHSSVGIPLAQELKKLKVESSEYDELSKTVGGKLSDIRKYPFLAGLLIKLLEEDVTSVCGATLVSDRCLVTAAHCWYDGKHHAVEYNVVLGSESLFEGGIRIKTNKVITHPYWNPEYFTNDIAIVHLPYKIGFSDSIKPVNLPSGADVDSNVGQWVTAVGYGKVNDEQTNVLGYVNEVDLQITALSDCAKTFGHEFVSPNVICTSYGHSGPCKGDSGGPLLKMGDSGMHILIGLSSYSAEEGCELGYPSGFTRISSYMDFIRQNMGY